MRTVAESHFLGESIEKEVDNILSTKKKETMPSSRTTTRSNDTELQLDEELQFEVTAASFDRTTGAATAALRSSMALLLDAPSPLAIGPYPNVFETPSDDNLEDDDASIGEAASVEDFQNNIHVADNQGHLVPYPGGAGSAGDDHHGHDHDGKSYGTEKYDEISCDNTIMKVLDDYTTYTTEPESEEGPAQENTAPKPASRSVISAGIESIKYLYSMGLLVFSVIVVMASIFANQTKGTAEMGIPSYAAFFIFWFLIVWLAMMEGGQAALVGLQPVGKNFYERTHPKAALTTQLAHRGDNMERFIVGRQFLVVLVVFVINMMASAVPDANVLGLTGAAKAIFLSTGVSLMVVTITLGQLMAQVNAANCMLDFINNYFMLFTTYVSLAIEKSGLLHSVYLVQLIFAKIAGNPIESNEAPRTGIQNVFFWGRVLMSLAVLGFAFAVTLKALFDGNTAMWAGVPEVVSVVILFILMAFVGMMEGMQIALFAVVNLPEEELQQHAVAHKNCQLAFMGQNLPSFLIGRQILATICMFVVARITTVQVVVGEGDNVFGVSDGLQEFFNTGLLGAVITTIIASLVWRIIASSFPLAFLSNPLIYVIIRLCLLVEQSGICSAAWVLARYHKPFANYQPDEVHLEGARPQTSEPVTRRDKDIDRLVTVFKFSYSLAFLTLAVVFVIAAIFQEQTTGTAEKGIHPAATFFIFWSLILWLAFMEGGQGALVGLRPIDPKKYADSHPRTLMNTKVVHTGDNMEHFIVGRQFLVVMVMFFTNLMASAINDSEVLGLDASLVEPIMFIAVALVTIILGQLTAQVSAAWSSLDFLNNYFMLLTTYISLAVEMSGLLHSVYLVQIFFSMITGEAIESAKAPRTKVQSLLFWCRVSVSLLILCFSLAVTLIALFDGNTTMWDSVPDVASVIIYFVLMCFIGLLEGIQIALFSVVNLPEVELRLHTVAYRNCRLAFQNHNLQAFLIGRQIFVSVCMFVLARISTLNIAVGQGNNIFGVSDTLQELFNTGILGAVIATIMASLIWRIIASSFPRQFLSSPLVGITIRVCLLVEASGVCSAAWVLGRWNKLLAGYQPDTVYLEKAERHTKDPVTRRDKDIDITVTVMKYLGSMALLVFSVAVVMGTIASKNTKFSQNTHPAVAFVLIWVLIFWLALMEGGQGCLVGLQPVPKDIYKDSHSVTLKNTLLAHKGENMERFIVGRQFLVVLVVFVINMSGSALPGTHVFNLPETVNEIFVSSGVAMILMTIVIGQLTAQINAANCMLDFINTYFMLFTTHVSLAIEFSGLLHCVYLVQITFSKIAGKPIDTSDQSLRQRLFFWIRALISLAILVLSFVVTLSALFAGKTAMWTGIPEAVSVVIFFVLMCFVGLMEGMQIALFAVVNLPEEGISMAAKATCKLTFQGRNLQAFLIGRQILVTICMFVVARITTITVAENESNIMGVSDGVQAFLNTGLLGAIITTLFASLAWRIVASSFPVAFLSNPLIYLILRMCLMIEATGVCASAWLLALIHKAIAGFKVDSEYLAELEGKGANYEKQDLEIQDEEA